MINVHPIIRAPGLADGVGVRPCHEGGVILMCVCVCGGSLPVQHCRVLQHSLLPPWPGVHRVLRGPGGPHALQVLPAGLPGLPQRQHHAQVTAPQPPGLTVIRLHGKSRVQERGRRGAKPLEFLPLSCTLCSFNLYFYRRRNMTLIHDTHTSLK